MLELTAARTGKVLIVGHRGALGHAPENTMPGFEKGRQLGADVMELDVHLTRDDVLVVKHAAEVSRTTDGRGRIREMTLAEIKRLDAGIKFDPRFRGERVPTLAEVLEWAKGRMPLAIELKGDPQPAPGLEQKLVQTIREHGVLDEVMAISFHHAAIRRVKELEPALATGILYEGGLVDTIGAARAARADSVRPSWSYWTADLVAEVHAAGLTASAWPANDEERIAYLVGLGVDSIGTDYPDMARAYLERIGRAWPRN